MSGSHARVDFGGTRHRQPSRPGAHQHARDTALGQRQDFHQIAAGRGTTICARVPLMTEDYIVPAD
jgi:hypothetical protein